MRIIRPAINNRPKYGNKKTQANGIWFDSKAEARYYLYLLAKKQRGEIKELTLQPRFLLQEAFRQDGIAYRKIEYVADFEVTHLDGTVEVIDVKGKSTKDFSMKKKMFILRYPDKKFTIIDAKTLQERKRKKK